MLQYITNPNSTTPIVDQVKQVIEGGCRWVQLCHKQASDDEIKDLVAQLKPICSQAETVLLLHSRVDLPRNSNSTAFSSKKATCLLLKHATSSAEVLS